mmetsp:Transcript_1302/g.3303  ORF Transcript_1302/g.3303 Transcript_1302/m.3303 type:complete len:461 (-) Transcript_1302:13-1395(-)
MAVKLLVLRSVEWLTNESRSPFAVSVFSEVVQLVREAFPCVNFAWLLLGIGRQVEPGCVGNLFPLPPAQESAPVDSESTSTFLEVNRSLRTVEDLYVATTHRGSLSIPSLSLPLLSTRISSLEECNDVLYHCLWAIKRNAETDSSFDWSSSERTFVRDLFRFGTQLEDLDETEFWGDDAIDIALPVPDVESPTKSRKKTHSGDVVLPTSPVIKKNVPRPTKNVDDRQRSSFTRYLIPQSIICSGRKKREERAVYEAASTFIVSGFEELEYGVDGEEAPPIDRRFGITWMMSKFFVTLCMGPKWKFAAAISELTTGQGSSRHNLFSLKPTSFADWASRLKMGGFGTFVCALPAYAGLEMDPLDDSNAKKYVVGYLTSSISRCEDELDVDEATRAMEFATLLLGRLRFGVQKNQNVAIGLILVAVIAGHTSGRIDTLMETLPDNAPIRLCYLTTKKAIGTDK